MSFSVLITLTTTGANTGPNFDLYSDTDYSTPFETNVLKTALVTGYTSTVVPNGTTIIRCTSKGTCTNSIDLNINGLPGVTPTPTVTSTPASTPPFGPTYQFRLGTGATAYDACNNYDPNNSNLYFSNVATLVNGSPLYTQAYPLQNNAPNGFYSNGVYSWYCVSGVLEGQAVCGSNVPTPTPSNTNQSYGFKTGTTYNSSSAACTAGGYPDGAYAFLPLANQPVPSVGNFFYKDAVCTPGNTFVGNGNWYVVRRSSQFLAIQVASTGEVLGVSDCNAGVTPTPTPTASPVLPSFFPITLNLQGAAGFNSSLTVYQSSDGSSYTSAQTLTATGANFASAGFNGTPGYYFYIVVTKTSGTGTITANASTVSANADLGIDTAACTLNVSTATTDPIQLPGTVVQSTIAFNGNLSNGCN